MCISQVYAFWDIKFISFIYMLSLFFPSQSNLLKEFILPRFIVLFGDSFFWPDFKWPEESFDLFLWNSPVVPEILIMSLFCSWWSILFCLLFEWFCRILSLILWSSHSENFVWAISFSHSLALTSFRIRSGKSHIHRGQVGGHKWVEKGRIRNDRTLVN